MAIPTWPPGGPLPPIETIRRAICTATREEILAWCQWVDPNGSYIDDLAIRDCGEPATREDAIVAALALLDDA